MTVEIIVTDNSGVPHNEKYTFDESNPYFEFINSDLDRILADILEYRKSMHEQPEYPFAPTKIEVGE